MADNQNINGNAVTVEGGAKKGSPFFVSPTQGPNFQNLEAVTDNSIPQAVPLENTNISGTVPNTLTGDLYNEDGTFKSNEQRQQEDRKRKEEADKKLAESISAEQEKLRAQLGTNPTGIVNKNSNKIFESMSGGSSTVLIEFPNYSKSEGSMFFLMKSIVSVSVSTARAKMPIIPLGSSTVDGFALGTKTVAGSIIKALTYEDEFSKAIEIFTQKSLANKKTTPKDLIIGGKYSSDFSNAKYNITQKEFDSIMRDDLIPFNIYTYSYSEYTGISHKCIMNCIYGCTIINEGQTLSIENLITENTITYVAKYAKLGLDVTKDFPSLPSNNTIMTGSKLLRRNKG